MVWAACNSGVGRRRLDNGLSRDARRVARPYFRTHVHRGMAGRPGSVSSPVMAYIARARMAMAYVVMAYVVVVAGGPGSVSSPVMAYI